MGLSREAVAGPCMAGYFDRRYWRHGGLRRRSYRAQQLDLYAAVVVRQLNNVCIVPPVNAPGALNFI